MIKMLLIFFKIGFLSFGGGWTTVGLIREDLISNGYMTLDIFSNAISISQMTPGPIAINLATYVGYINFGFWGALLNTIFFLIPPILILYFFRLLQNNILKMNRNILMNSLKLGTAILISMTLISFLKPLFKEFDYRVVLIALTSYFLFNKTKINPAYTILLSGFVGIILFNFL
ncbi:chromate transporter [Tepiditoga spiralis]|uniref:Chromate transporter n=1 Tax=Tepiditoga spiralis TaxID=2108365 RepID=A0A7G1G4B7_9BACT|nr:chromate transporter [Tepiditoga spiralis]BBE31340.1 chromate transporter [Tepiditoga spiralis]